MGSPRGPREVNLPPRVLALPCTLCPLTFTKEPPRLSHTQQSHEAGQKDAKEAHATRCVAMTPEISPLLVDGHVR